ncbi:hypothetical protein H7347_07220 [Corynebacterium sp. zg-331]|uniref:phage tail protein n=1 Tax=unclassified Corynebacterium TaxID=2624378 RepID=UPI00128B6A08|nr:MULTISPECIES: hypothetical protein [unclassified Corynebacterium]MBC3186363.1 hypothetical protein [Corynebacterium sp. zg-331]MPV52850.1 hypothetical protein [Corynebacterium sp. zg331]
MAEMGKTIGAANIRIMPNTKNFAASLKRFLERMERQNRLQVNLELDQSGFTAAVRTAIQAAQAAAGDVRIGFDTREAELITSVRRAVSAAQAASGKIDVKMRPNTMGLAIAARAATKAASTGLTIWAKLKVDKTSLLATMALMRTTSHFFGSSMLPHLTALPATMGMLAASKVAIGGIAPAIAAIGSAAAGTLGPVLALTAAMSPAAIGATALSIGALVQVFKGMGAAITAATPEDLADALGELPPAAQEAALSLRGLRASFMGMGDDIKQSFWEPLSNFGQLNQFVEPLRLAMQVVAADMGKAAAGLVDFVSQGTGLSAVAQLIGTAQVSASNLSFAFASLTRGIIAVGAAAGPIFERLTAHINQAAAAWSDRMVAGFQDGSLQAYFENAVAKAKEFWAVMQQLGGIISGVWAAMNAAGAPLLGTISQAIEATNRWVNSAEGFSTLVSFFSAMQAAVGTLLPIFGQLAEIVGGTLAPAIAATIQALGPGLSAVVDGLGQGLQNAAAGAAPLGSALNSVLLAAAPLLPALGQIAGQISGVLASALSIGAGLLERFGGVLTAAIPAIVAVVAAFAGFSKIIPIIQMVGTAVSLLGGPMTLVVAGIAALVAAMMTVPGVMEPMKAAFMQVVEAIMPLVPIFMELVQTLMGALMPVVAALVPIIIQIVQVIAQVVVALTPIIAAIFQLAGVIISALMPVVTSLLPVMSSLISIFSSVVSAIAPLIAILVQVAAGFIALLAEIVGFVGSVLGLIASLVAGVISGFVSMISTVIAAVGGFVSRLLAIIGSLVSTWYSQINNLWGMVTAIFSSGISTVVSLMGSLPGKVLSALGDMGSLLVASGKAVIQGFIDGIKSMIGAVADAAKSAVQAARNFFPFSPAKKGPFSGHGYTLYSGRALGKDFAGGIEDTAADAAAASGKLAAAAHRNLAGYRADAHAVAAVGASAGGRSGAGGDYSIHIDTYQAADMSKPVRDMEEMQLKNRIRKGDQ